MLEEILKTDKKARKWHPKTRKYYEYLLPVGSVMLVGLDEKASCAECGVQFTFGDMYASRFIHNHVGIMSVWVTLCARLVMTVN